MEFGSKIEYNSGVVAERKSPYYQILSTLPAYSTIDCPVKFYLLPNKSVNLDVNKKIYIEIPAAIQASKYSYYFLSKCRPFCLTWRINPFPSIGTSIESTYTLQSRLTAISDQQTKSQIISFNFFVPNIFCLCYAKIILL